MPRTPRFLLVLAVAAFGGVLPAAAEAQSPGSSPASPQPSLSTNWAGYAVAGSSGSPRTFSSVSGTWVAPTATCTPGSPTYSAFWVGLGGLSQNSQALEQTGTEADCSPSGHPQYSTWYELVPDPPVTMSLNVAPGDTVIASVTEVAHRVTIRLTDHTQGTSVTKHLRTSVVDLSSAEWIAEAPSQCDNSGNCVPTPLTNFGTVAFSNASATSAGHTGPITDTDWADQAIELQSDPGRSGHHRFARSIGTVTAAPSALSATGDAFSVAYSQSSGQLPGPTVTFHQNILAGR
jgi:Peptidase A4 family